MKMGLSRCLAFGHIKMVWLLWVGLFCWLLPLSAQAQTPGYSLKNDWPATELTGKSIALNAVNAGYLVDATGKLDIVEVLQR